MKYNFARRMNQLKASEIRELLKVTESKEVISFGGGMPAPELFPLEEIKRVSQIVLTEDGADALQYTTTEGYRPLREWIAARMNQQMGSRLTPDHIMLTNGSQQALDFSGKLFLDEGDVVLCESPTYLAAISAFRSYSCRFGEVDTDNEGMIPEALEKMIESEPRVKLIYTIPNFQNPTGRCWTMERRKQVKAIADRYNLVIIEDNPYGELRFEGETIPCIKSLDTTGNVIYFGTFSKIFCPGYRIGWVAADPQLINKYVLVKQGADLQCNTLAQREIARYLELYDIDEHIGKIKKTYLRRRDLAVRVMTECFPRSVTFTRPEGGLFLWITLPKGCNARSVLEDSLQQGVAFVPGGSFYPNGGNENTMRINFSYMPEDKIEKGLRILAGILSNHC